MRVDFLNRFRTHSRLRLAATLFCLLACTLQSFVAQTHVHGGRPHSSSSSSYFSAVGVDAVSVASGAEESFGKHNRGDGSQSCPLCQIVLHGGAAPAPTFAFSLPSTAAVFVAPPEQLPTAALVAVSFNWQGRAPPLI